MMYMPIHNVNGTTQMRETGRALRHKPHMKYFFKCFHAFLSSITLGESKQVRVTWIGNRHNTDHLSGGCR